MCTVQVARNWVAQLQLEMLAAPADSALLVSRSASKVLLSSHSPRPVHTMCVSCIFEHLSALETASLAACVLLQVMNNTTPHCSYARRPQCMSFENCS